MPYSQWCHPATSSSAVPFSSCLQSFPASRSFPVSRLFTPGGQSIGASASASVLSVNIQDWFPLGLTGWISLKSMGLSGVFSNTIVQKHQFFSISASSEHPGLISLGWTGWIFLQSKGLSRVFSNTTVQKRQFFGAQLSSLSNSHIHTWPLEKP